MKKKFFTLFLGLCLLSSILFSGRGTAYISHYFASNSDGVIVAPYFYLSNITGIEVTVEVVFYQKDNSSGNPVVLLDGDDNQGTGNIRADNVSDYEESPASGASVKFNIAPYETAYISINLSSGTQIGYGRIEYSQSSSSMVALIGYGLTIVTDSTNYRSESTIAINNGLPF